MGGVVSGLVQGVTGSNAIRKAGQAQQTGYNEAMGTIAGQYGTTQGYLDPYTSAGTSAMKTLADYMGTSGNTGADNYGSLMQPYSGQDLYNDPSYQFRLEQGQKALERSASARGMSLSGGQAKALTNYGQQAASQEYQNAYNRYMQNRQSQYQMLSGMGSMGLSSANAQANLSNQYGSNLANLQTGKAAANANTTMANWSNWMGAGNQILGSAGNSASSALGNSGSSFLTAFMG